MLYMRDFRDSFAVSKLVRPKGGSKLLHPKFLNVTGFV